MTATRLTAFLIVSLLGTAGADPAWAETCKNPVSIKITDKGFLEAKNGEKICTLEATFSQDGRVFKVLDGKLTQLSNTAIVIDGTKQSEIEVVATIPDKGKLYGSRPSLTDGQYELKDGQLKLVPPLTVWANLASGTKLYGDGGAQPPKDGPYDLKNGTLTQGAANPDKISWLTVAVAIVATALLSSLCAFIAYRKLYSTLLGEIDLRLKQRQERGVPAQADALAEAAQLLGKVLGNSLAKPVEDLSQAVQEGAALLKLQTYTGRQPDDAGMTADQSATVQEIPAEHETDSEDPERILEEEWEDILNTGYADAVTGDGPKRAAFLEAYTPVAFEPGFSFPLKKSQDPDCSQAMLWGFHSRSGYWLVALGPQGFRDFRNYATEAYTYIFDLSQNGQSMCTPAVLTDTLDLSTRGSIQ